MHINTTIHQGTAIEMGYVSAGFIWELKDIETMLQDIAHEWGAEKVPENVQVDFFQREAGKEIYIGVKYTDQPLDENLRDLALELETEIIGRRSTAEGQKSSAETDSHSPQNTEGHHPSRSPEN